LVRFQYVRCQFDNLKRFKSPAEIQRALKELPQGLDETYERILRNIDPIYQTRVASCLQWLASAHPMLTIHQLAEVFVLRPAHDTIIDEDERIFDPDDLLTWLHSLVIVEQWSHGSSNIKSVRLSHYSIKEYLTSNRICEDLAPVFAFTDDSACLWIARSSLAYVLHTGVTCRIAEITEKYFAPANGDHRGTLRWYTARYWPKHLEKVPRKLWPADLVEMAKSALSAQSQGLVITLLPRHLRLNISETLQHPYIFTVLAGYSQLTELILSNDLSTSRYLTQKEMNTMLMAAVWAGSKERVSALLGRGAGVSGEGNDSHLLCRLAAYTGRPDIAKILLESCADMHTQCRPALEGAAEQEGQQEPRILKRLISRIVDFDNLSRVAESDLHSAARRRNDTSQLELLLAKGVDINMRGAGDDEKTALYVAASRGRWHNFDLLLQRGADVNIGGKYGSPLHALAQSDGDVDGALIRMQRLIEMGADPKAQCEELGTALHVACGSNWRRIASIRIAQLLVESGVDVNAVGGDIRLAEWLLGNKADVNLQGGKYGNALQAACKHRQLEMVQLLLAHGADVNAAGGEYGTALQAAAWTYRGDELEQEDTEVIRLLLERGANVNTQGGKYGNALNAAAAAPTHNLALLKLLLEHGADVNQVCGEFGTALHSVLTMQQEEWTRHGSLRDLCIGKIQLLLDNGADISLSGGDYGLLLHSACALGSSRRSYSTMNRHMNKMDTVTSTIKFLFDHKPSIDVNAHSGIFGTALQAAAYSGLAEPTRLLLDRGALVACHEWCGKYGSALNAAVIKGRWDIVNLLREAGAKPDCFSMQKPDEEWLQKIRQEDGSEAEERYRMFWESEKPIQDQTLFSRLSLFIVAYLSLLLVPFQLFISFRRTELIRPKKRQ
jgi:ankyrin repeat protein